MMPNTAALIDSHILMTVMKLIAKGGADERSIQSALEAAYFTGMVHGIGLGRAAGPDGVIPSETATGATGTNHRA